MSTRRGHELANGGGFTAEVHATRRFLRVVSCPPHPEPGPGAATPARRDGGSLRRRLVPGTATIPARDPLIVIAAGIVAIAIGTLLLQSYGPRVRVGRLLAVTPAVTFAAARRQAPRVATCPSAADPSAADPSAAVGSCEDPPGCS